MDKQDTREWVLGEMVRESLRAAASEVLGKPNPKFDEYFHIATALYKDSITIAVIEKVTGMDTTIAIDAERLENEESDAFFYPRLRELAQLIDPFIPDEEKDIYVDAWPEPVWEPPKESND